MAGAGVGVGGGGTAEADAAAGGKGRELLSDAKRAELMRDYVMYYHKRQQHMQAMFLLSEMVSAPLPSHLV